MAQVEHYQTSNILIVDDEPANVLLLQSIFEASGYTRIKTTIDPRQVTSMVAMFQPDLILLDLHLELTEYNSHLEERIGERTRELEEAQIEILERLASVTEYRDDETCKH